MATRLNINTLETIKSDADLFALVAKALKIKPTSMPQTLQRNNSHLTEYKVLKVISAYTGKQHSELIEEYDDSKDKDGTEIQQDQGFTAVRTTNIETKNQTCNSNL